MVFGWVKKKLNRTESYDEIKEHVLGDRFLPKDLPSPPPEPAETPTLFREPTEMREPLKEPPLREPMPEPGFTPRERDVLHSDIFSREREPLAPPSLEPSREFISSQRSERKIEHIEEELAFVKEQLAAIRAQNEAINERLKNIERRLSGAY